MNLKPRLVAGVESFDTAYMLATDALGVGLGNGLVLLFIWMLCRLWFAPSRRAWRAAFGAVLCGAIAVGCYEHAALAAITAAAAAMAMALLYRHPHRGQFAVVLVLVAVFVCIAFFAPGNFVRREDRGGAFGHVLATVVAEGKGVAANALQPGYIATALAIGCLLRPRWRQSLAERLSLPVVLLLGALGYAAFMGGMVFFHALADFDLAIVPKLLTSCVLLGAYWTAFVILACGEILRRAVRAVPRFILILPVMGLLVLSPPYQKTFVNALGGNILDYYRIQAGRWDWLKTCPGQDVVIPEPEVSPYPMYTLDWLWKYSRAAGEWPNVEAAQVYGVKSITREPLSPQSAYQAIQAAYNGVAVQQETSGHRQSRIFFSVNPGPNELFERDWLLLRPERPVGRLSTLLLLEPERGRLIPRWVQRRIAPSFAAREQLSPGLCTSLLGPVRTFEPEKWLVPGLGEAAYLLPLRKPTKRKILAAYVSIDGGAFQRVYAPAR